MRQKDRRLLFRLSIGLVLVWFVGDFLLGGAVSDSLDAAQREAADLARSNENRRMMGNYTSFRGGPRPRHSLGAVKGFHETVRVPLRIAGAVGLLMFFLVGARGGWLTKMRRENKRALTATILLMISVSLFAVAQVIVYANTTTVLNARRFTTEEIERDHRERTISNPPELLNPNPGMAGPASITMGQRRSERLAVNQVEPNVLAAVMLTRVIAAAFGLTGILYGLFSIFVASQNESRSADADDTNQNVASGEQ